MKRLTIVVNFNVRYKAARDMIAGTMRYAAAHPGWELVIRGNHPSNDGFAIDRNCPIDGLISGYDLNRADEPGQTEIRRLLRRGSTLKGLTVISVPPPAWNSVPFASIDVDHREIARAAAKIFLSHGLTNFAFVGSPQQPDLWSHARREHFRREIERHGFVVSCFESGKGKTTDWTDQIARLGQWLKELPKPCGIFAAFDQRAKHVIDVCRQQGINIPKEIQIVGVDNEDSTCELTIPSLSSIAPDFEAAGYAAAQELDRLMHGGSPRKNTILIKAHALVERMSTSDLTRTGERVNRALDYIRQHAAEPIGVGEVARSVGGSSRLLEMDFKKVLGRTICREIQDVRLKAVAAALRDSSKPLADIARNSGFGSESYLKTLFRKRFGMTMSGYRTYAS